MKFKKIPPPFTTHKITLKAIQKWDGFRYNWTSPIYAINYLYNQERFAITILKQRETSITILIECSDSAYEHIKLDFVRKMGDKFIWKD